MSRKPKENPEETMRRSLSHWHKAAVRELEMLRRAEEYRRVYVRIMMATSSTLIENAPLQELERIDDWIHKQFDALEDAA
ncbi:hypothetical protein [Bradyrhizobium sp. Leo170]|uniref:hypothetical protein n=1 Tax=Bradyrhizobium sp. Leo170 TaxID=1571199 RepID=UPI00102EC922|nr:hypothetical protein [Bradyrhizobium sp. Leo170]